MNKYIIPKIICAIGALMLFLGFFFSVLNLTLGNFFHSFVVSLGLTVLLSLSAILAFNMKTAHKKKIKKIIKCKTIEFFSLFVFVIVGLLSLLVFNHCITVWLSSDEIKKNLNVRQLEKIFPEYENYANIRIENYENQLNDAISNKNARKEELSALGFIESNEALSSQRNRKINKLKDVLRPNGIYSGLKDTIQMKIADFIDIVENFSPITAPKNITTIEQWGGYFEKQLIFLSQPKMKGENAKDFQFETTFKNVESILTDNTDYFSHKRYIGYVVGGMALFCMLFPYLLGNRSIKITKFNN